MGLGSGKRGAGEILFTSMTHDGVKDGYANDALATLADTLHIPVIAPVERERWNISGIRFPTGKRTRL